MSNNLKETNVEEQLRALYDLQLIESRSDEIRNFIGDVPFELQKLKKEIEILKQKWALLKEDINTFKSQIIQKIEIISESDSLLKQYNKKKDNVRNNRESLNKEKEYQELEIALSSKIIKEMEGKIKKTRVLYQKFEDLFKEKKTQFAKKQSEYSILLKKYHNEQEYLSKKAQNFSKKVWPYLLETYKKIRARTKNGLAIVPLERSTATGSFLIITPQKCIDIIHSQKIIIDEYSGRILIDKNLALEEREKIIPFLKEARNLEQKL